MKSSHTIRVHDAATAPEPFAIRASGFHRIVAIAFFLVGSGGSLWADDTKPTGPAAPTNPALEQGGFLELGIGVHLAWLAQERLVPAETGDVELRYNGDLSFAWRYRKLFIQADAGRFDNLKFGISVWHDERWVFDVLLSNAIQIDGFLTDDAGLDDSSTDAERVNRDTNYLGSGFAMTGYFGESVAQFKIVHNWYDNRGTTASAKAGRQWQLGNWNLQAVAGLFYVSNTTSQAVWGIDEEDSSARLPRFDSPAAVLPELEIMGARPLGKRWVFRTNLLYRHYPSAIAESPLLSGDDDLIWLNSFNFVLL